MARPLHMVLFALPFVSVAAIAGDGSCRNAPVSIDRAIAIAREAGVAYISEVECDRERWEIEGRHVDGRWFEVGISARDGRVLKTAYD